MPTIHGTITLGGIHMLVICLISIGSMIFAALVLLAVVVIRSGNKLSEAVESLRKDPWEAVERYGGNLP